MKHLIVKCPRHWGRREPIAIIVDDDVYEWASQKQWKFDDAGRVIEVRVGGPTKQHLRNGKQLSRLILGLNPCHQGVVKQKEFSDDYRRENLIVSHPNHPASSPSVR